MSAEVEQSGVCLFDAGEPHDLKVSCRSRGEWRERALVIERARTLRTLLRPSPSANLVGVKEKGKAAAKFAVRRGA